MQTMQEGQTIKHDVYGLGIVTSSDGERTAVDFDDHGPKLFVTSIMTAELIGEAPATPPKTKRRRKASTAAKAAKAAMPSRKPGMDFCTYSPPLLQTKSSRGRNATASAKEITASSTRSTMRRDSWRLSRSATGGKSIGRSRVRGGGSG